MRLCLTVTLGAFNKVTIRKHIPRHQSEWRMGSSRKLEMSTRTCPLPPEACGMEPCPKTTVLKSGLNQCSWIRQILGGSFKNQKSRWSIWASRVRWLWLWRKRCSGTAGISRTFGKMTLCLVSEIRGMPVLLQQRLFSSTGFQGLLKWGPFIGVDLFVPNKLQFMHRLMGWSSSQDNAGDLDYGPTIILEHHPESGPDFYTLYGHLSRCLKLVKIGQKAGEAFAATGNCDENGVGRPISTAVGLISLILKAMFRCCQSVPIWSLAKFVPGSFPFAAFVRETSVMVLIRLNYWTGGKRFFDRPHLSRATLTMIRGKALSFNDC